MVEAGVTSREVEETIREIISREVKDEAEAGDAEIRTVIVTIQDSRIMRQWEIKRHSGTRRIKIQILPSADRCSTRIILQIR